MPRSRRTLDADRFGFKEAIKKFYDSLKAFGQASLYNYLVLRFPLPPYNQLSFRQPFTY